MQAEQRAPEVSGISIMRFSAGALTGRADEAAAGLDRLLARFPADLKEVDEWMVWQLLREQPEGSSVPADNRRIALVRAGFGEENGDRLTTSAIAILLKRGGYCASQRAAALRG
jgi:hypothetical protein